MKVFSMKSLILVGLFVALSVPAQANTISVFNQTLPDGSDVSYFISHSEGELHPGDGFTVFDIGGFTGIISTPTDWSGGATFTGSPFGPSAGFDDPTLANVHFVWTGGIIEHSLASPPATQTYFNFIVGTNTSLFTLDDSRSQDHTTAGDEGPQVPGFVVVPFGPAGPGAVPDGGSTAALLGSVLVAFGVLRRRFS